VHVFLVCVLVLQFLLLNMLFINIHPTKKSRNIKIQQLPGVAFVIGKLEIQSNFLIRKGNKHLGSILGVLVF